jgi:hypothetical protein
MAGHVFVVHGDLRALACDAWLLPTDGALHITRGWLENWPRPLALPERIGPPLGWKGGSLMRWEGWPAERSPPWLVALGSLRRAASWPVTCARSWLEAVAAHLAGKPARNGRSKPLVALPAVGTGHGGQRHETGTVLRELLPALREAASAYGLDIALVCNEEDTFTAARALRAQGEPHTWWPELSAEQRAQAIQLGESASAGKVVIFIGAGVSVGAGLPLWSRLLDDLAKARGIPIEEGGWQQLDLLDRATYLQRLSEGHAPLREEIARYLQKPEASLQHLLLAGLPVSEYVTTNYDDLLELASLEPFSILPHAPRADTSRWLLKMHGSVDQREDIVLTREDYLRYEERRAALAGIVQAMLMTRRMLFVGFSLKDDNFHKIADAVRRARAGSSVAQGMSAPFGAVLQLESQPFVERLWQGELDFLPMGAPLAPGSGAEQVAERARRLEIFLDCVLAHAPRAPLHFMSQRFGSALSSEERELRDSLATFLRDLPPKLRSGPAWSLLEHLAEQLGARS